jgi:predicted RNase H-like HicB family nuclease
MIVKVVITRGEDGYFVARCPSLISCWSQGKTRQEALANIQEAIILYLEPQSQDVAPDGIREVVELAM